MKYRPLAFVYYLGIICLLCAGCGQDELKALRKKAKRGDVSAQIKLAEAYISEKASPEKRKEAFKWLYRSAENGDAVAQYAVGRFFFVGKDFQEAALWFELSAEQGNDMGRYYLGVLYLTGNGVPKDERKGFSYWGEIEDPEVQSLAVDAIRAMGSLPAQKSSRQQQMQPSQNEQYYQQQQLQMREDRRLRDLQRSVLEGQYRELYPNATPHLGW